MDMHWAETTLQEYLTICDEIRSHQRAIGSPVSWDDVCEDLNRKALGQLSTVERIVRYMQVGAPDRSLRPPAYSMSADEEWVRRALGAVQRHEDVEQHFRTEAPTLVADEMHPVVWAAAEGSWGIGQYDTALEAACVALSGRIRGKANSRLRERKLVNEVFAPGDPGPGKSRLHFPGDHADDTWKSRQDGLHLLAQGVFAGVRNVVAHEERDMTQQEALEQLAILSALARWADQTELVEGPPVPGD